MSNKTHIDSSTPRSNAMKPMQEANGAPAITPPSSVADLTSAPKAKTAAASSFPSQQTHGALLPSGPITSVSQLTRGRSQAKGAIGSFDTVQDYGQYLNGLTLGALHRHAVEEARVVPIDNRERLIRRLEGEFTSLAAKSPGYVPKSIPQPPQYTQEQLDRLDAIRNKLLRKS